MSFGLVLLIAAVFIIFYGIFKIVLVTTNHVAVCASLGRRFTRVVKEGFTWLNPLEGVLDYDWTYVDQTYKTHHFKGTELRLTGV